MRIHLLVLTLLGSGALIGWKQQSEFRDLRQQQIILREAAGEKHLLAEQLAALPPTEVDRDELAVLRQSRHELVRMRGEIGLLRQMNQSLSDETEESIARMLDETEEANARTEAIRASERVRKIPEAAQAALKGLLTVFLKVSAHTGRRPDTFEELKAGADILYGPGACCPLAPDPILGKVEEFFDLVTSFPGTPAPGTAPVFREKTPRQTPDGGWVRLYAFPNLVSEVFLSENLFDEWERDMHVYGAPQQ
jgi:hypothetical protein